MALIKRAAHVSFHRVLGTVTLAVYESAAEQAVALLYGNPAPHPDLPVRIQAACTYGDALAISECDCRQQLKDTFGRFLESRKGILIFLKQEGEGAGLGVQAEACQLSKEESLDAVQAYERLGVLPDHRGYELAIEILRDLGMSAFVLLTNNPRKLDALTAAGINVRREQMPVRPTVDNLAYLEAKQTRLRQPLGLTVPNGDRSTNPHCFVVGAAAMDHVFEVRHNPPIGKTRQASRYRRRPGGKAFNQAVALSRLGANATLLTVRGNDPDSAEISNVLALEGVRDLHTGTPEGLRTPQTVVLQPPDSSPTYVGWLGAEHRTLRRQIIIQHQDDIERCDAVLVTLESSEDAVDYVVRRARPNALVLLNASPIAEPPYELGTDTLEHVGVLVGSKDELATLIPQRHRRRANDADNELEIAQRLAHLCGITVVLTAFRLIRPWVLVVNPFVTDPVRVFAGDVRRVGVSDAIGCTDVFCAELTLRMLSLSGAAQLPQTRGVWRSEGSPLARREHLIDATMLAMGAEAYVARSKGGYKAFPKQGTDFERWCRDHPPNLEPADTTLREFHKRDDVTG